MNFTEMLEERLREATQQRAEQQRKEKEACDKMRAACGVEQHAQFHMLIDAIEDFAGVASTMHTLMQKRRHMPSAKMGLEAVTYLRDAVSWCYDMCEKAQVDPEIYGLKGGRQHAERYLSEKQDSYRKFIDTYEPTATVAA